MSCELEWKGITWYLRNIHWNIHLMPFNKIIYLWNNSWTEFPSTFSFKNCYGIWLISYCVRVVIASIQLSLDVSLQCFYSESHFRLSYTTVDKNSSLRHGTESPEDTIDTWIENYLVFNTTLGDIHMKTFEITTWHTYKFVYITVQICYIITELLLSIMIWWSTCLIWVYWSMFKDVKIPYY